VTSPAALAGAADAVVAAALRADPDAQARLRRLAGKVLAVEFQGLGWVLTVEAVDDALRIEADPAREPHARIAGLPASLAMMARQGGTRVLFSGAVAVSGDVTVARGYKRLFDTLDPDWEEVIAGVGGDVAAHELARAGRGAADWLHRALAGRRADLRAWLTDELASVPPRAEVEDWLDDVDRLRHDTDRLSARLARLERLGGGGGQR
jgi:ubiquinone biosynthesis protein UbiJ